MSWCVTTLRWELGMVYACTKMILQTSSDINIEHTHCDLAQYGKPLGPFRKLAEDMVKIHGSFILHNMFILISMTQTWHTSISITVPQVHLVSEVIFWDGKLLCRYRAGRYAPGFLCEPGMHQLLPWTLYISIQYPTNPHSAINYSSTSLRECTILNMNIEKLHMWASFNAIISKPKP